MNKLLLLSVISSIGINAFAQNTTMTAIVNSDRTATIANDMISINIGKDGRASKMYLNGSSENLLASSGIYFDYTAAKNTALSPSKAEVIKLTDDYAEILYSNTTADLQFQQGYILRKGVSGVYVYIIANGTASSSSVSVKEARVCTRLNSKFLNGYVDEVMNGMIPSNAEMKIAEKSENTIQDATYRLTDGSIYTKYNWAQFIDRDKFHGLMTDNVGVWNIPVSYEWLNGGPMRQELTVHATSKSPITIQMLQGEHLGGAAQSFSDGEQKIFGPFFIYVNQGTANEMIADAAAQTEIQKSQWPYQWYDNSLYPTTRGSVKGHFNVSGYENSDLQIVLSTENNDEIIRHGKSYVFWDKTDENGNFIIKNVRPATYNIYAYATKGGNTEQFKRTGITVTDGELDLGTIDWTPTVHSHRLWMIGENNRLSDGFNMSDTPRAYGLWENVPADLTYTIGQSTPENDWYYAQCHNGTWSIVFNLDKNYEGEITLTASSAGATNKPKVNVSVNGTKKATWSYSNNDAAIYRSAVQAGRHSVKTLKFSASDLKIGENKIEFNMTGISKNGGVMWDCIKLEADTESAISEIGIDTNATPITVYGINGTYIGTYDSIDDTRLPHGLYIYRQGSKTGKFVK